MKQTIVYLFLMIFFLCACSKKKDPIAGNLNPSYGNRNEVVLVIDDSLWIGATGDSIRSRLAMPTRGLPEEEPVFDLVQIDPRIFTTKIRTARNVVLFSTNTAQEFLLEKSFYATPQNFFFVRAQNSGDLIKLFKSHSDSIISVFKASELNEQMHQIVRSSNGERHELKDFFGCTLKIPDDYYLQVENDFPFLWYQKDLSSGNLNLVLYEFPIAEIENSSGSVEEHLIAAKNYIGKEFLKTAKDSAYVITNSRVVPVFGKSTLQNFPVYQMIGNWETVNDYLTGPFICYAIRDDYYKRYLFIEGYINNPFRNKRDQLLEMEAIIKTVNFNENTD